MFLNRNDKEIARLKEESESKDVVINQLRSEVEDYQKTIASFHLSTSKYDKEMEALKKKHQQEMAELVHKLAETEMSVNKRVNQTLQSVGVNTFLCEIPTELKSSKDVYQKFLAMPNGSAKQEFYQKHEKEIRAGMNS